MAKWQVQVDREACIGTGMCASSAAAYFRLENGKVTAVRDSIEPDELVTDAAESCPMEAILVRDGDGVVIAPEP
ncbi:ferredoxin [Umezawaea sp. Da 62-37]|uniref:ferredoxin n=1 Tax=Umezawaea sp. Da 62-37 TaxID=3075927 RepID=UPI0028F74D42|nr:ferredoxin [Umezawaea sp. Da 62-37]WNV83310.1 ferredoxin [Umezawaea sp. Da 62-37]